MSKQKKQATEAGGRMIRCRGHRKLSPEENVRVVLGNLRGEQSNSELYHREGIAANLNYLEARRDPCRAPPGYIR
jgi:hypothetical protein